MIAFLFRYDEARASHAGRASQFQPRSVNVEASERPKRLWYRQKRWIAAAVLWLVVLHQVSHGPANYCYARGWVPAWVPRSLFAFWVPDEVGEATGLFPFSRWCGKYGFLHRK